MGAKFQHNVGLTMTRWSAGGLHLLISLMIGLVFVGLTLYVWYPGPLFEVSGAIGLLSILVPVDVVLGPFLTLLVFKRGKPLLMAIDMSCIVTAQVAALLYGAWTIAEVRPAYIVLFDKRFEVVRSMDIAKGTPWKAPLAGPEWVAVLPKNAEEILKDLKGGVLPTRDTRQFQPLDLRNADFKSAMRTVASIKSQTIRAQIIKELEVKDIKPEQVWLVPMLVRDLAVTAVFDKDRLMLTAILPTSI